MSILDSHEREHIERIVLEEMRWAQAQPDPAGMRYLLFKLGIFGRFTDQQLVAEYQACGKECWRVGMDLID